MDAWAEDRAFEGSVPKVYARHMVPLFFAPYAEDLAARAAARRPARVLELAAGTGVLTRRLAERLGPSVPILATDLNPGMLQEAAAEDTPASVTWQPADAQCLPFENGAFDLVVCQFGVMFFPDKAAAFAEARRVLAPGGTLLFSVWDGLATNAFAAAVTEALAACFPEAPSHFIARVPHGYFDPVLLTRDLASGGFGEAPEVVAVEGTSRADAARTVALALCQGTPMRGEIEARRPGGLAEVTASVEALLARRFGPGPVEGRMRAFVVAASR